MRRFLKYIASWRWIKWVQLYLLIASAGAVYFDNNYPRGTYLLVMFIALEVIKHVDANT